MEVSTERDKKFFDKVCVTSGCWIWTGSKTSTGYGDFRFCKFRIKAHRYSFYIYYGYITDKFVLHSCDNPLCVNPKHLREGDGKENCKDMVSRNRHANQVKVKCPKGHFFTEENTYFHKNGSRRCKKCHYDYYQKSKKSK